MLLTILQGLGNINPLCSLGIRLKRSSAEGWQSGRMRRTRNPVYGYTVSRVRIPPLPPRILGQVLVKSRAWLFYISIKKVIPRLSQWQNKPTKIETSGLFPRSALWFFSSWMFVYGSLSEHVSVEIADQDNLRQYRNELSAIFLVRPSCLAVDRRGYRDDYAFATRNSY